MKDIQDVNQLLSVWIFIKKMYHNSSWSYPINSLVHIANYFKNFKPEEKFENKHELIDKPSMLLKSLACSFKYSQSSKHDHFKKHGIDYKKHYLL